MSNMYTQIAQIIEELVVKHVPKAKDVTVSRLGTTPVKYSSATVFEAAFREGRKKRTVTFEAWQERVNELTVDSEFGKEKVSLPKHA